MLLISISNCPLTKLLGLTLIIFKSDICFKFTILLIGYLKLKHAVDTVRHSLIKYPFSPCLLKCKQMCQNVLPQWSTVSFTISVTRKKSPNVYKSCPKMISLEKLKILTPLQKLPKDVGDLGKLIVAKGFKK